MDHNERSAFHTIEVPQRTEDSGSEQIFQGAAPEVCGGSGNNGWIIFKDCSQKASAEESEQKNTRAEHHGNAAGNQQGTPGPGGLSGSHVLGHESGKSRHEGHRDDGEEYEKFLRDADTSRLCHTQAIDDTGNHQKGDIYQEILQGNGGAQRGDPHNAAAGAKAFSGEGKGERTAADIEKGE